VAQLHTTGAAHAHSANAAHGLAGPASRSGPRARGPRWEVAHATASVLARARAAFALARRPRRSGGSGLADGDLRHAGVTPARGRLRGTREKVLAGNA
jgi:hypothetical protein